MGVYYTVQAFTSRPVGTCRILRCRVSDLGFRVSDFGFRVSDSGFRVSGLGVRNVKALGECRLWSVAGSLCKALRGSQGSRFQSVRSFRA